MVTDPIDEFWAWWEDARVTARRALSDGVFGSLPEELTRRLRGIDEELDWELGRSAATDRWSLVISADGDPELRRVAEQVCALAPADDPDFEYLPARQADPGVADLALTVDGRRVAVADMRFAVTIDRDHHRMDVAVYHAAFADVDESGRLAVAFMALDKLLGEDAVERWVGRVSTTADEPGDALSPRQLADGVAETAAAAPVDGWVDLLLRTPDAVVRVGVRRPLHWLDRPLLTRLAILTRPYQAGADGQPTAELRRRLDDEESGLWAGGTAAGDTVRLMTRTARGERTTVLATDPDADLAPIRAWAEDRGAKLETLDDPGWGTLRAYA